MTFNPYDSEEEEEEGGSPVEAGVEAAGVFGFLSNPLSMPAGLASNFFQETKDMASGLWKVAGDVVHDTSTVAGDALDLKNETDPEDYVLDEMWQSVFGTGEFAEQGSVVVNDYQERYGTETGLLGGHFGQMYDRPLSFMTDALTVATAGGYGAAKGAQLAGKIGSVGRAGSTLDDIARLGRAGQAASPAAEAAMAELASMPAAARAARIVKAIEGAPRYIYNPVSGKVEVVAQSWNPARRLLYQNNYMRLSTKPTKWFEAKAAKAASRAEAIGPGADRYAAKAAQYQRIVEDTLAAGVGRSQRISGPLGANRVAAKFVDKAVGYATGKSARLTSEVSQSYADNFGDVGKELVDDDTLVDTMQGIDNDLTSDGTVAAGRVDPQTGEMSGYRRAEQFEEDGVATIDNGPTRWADQPGEDLDALISERTLAGKEVGLGMDEQASARLTKKLEHAQTNGHADEVQPGVWAIRPGPPSTAIAQGNEVNATRYLMVDDSGQVISSRLVSRDGRVIAEGRSGLPHTLPQSPGDTLVDAHWADQGIDTPEKIADAIRKQELTPAGAALSRRAVARHVPKVDEGPRLPAKGTAHRETYEAAVKQAEADVVDLTPKLRDEFGNDAKVVPGKPKKESATRAKAELADKNWRDVEDISRFRVIAEDAWERVKTTDIIARLQKTTGGKVKKVENSINNPMPNGERGVRVVIEMPDGHPVEFQILTPAARQVLDATEGLRGLMRTMGVVLKRGEDIGDSALKLRKAERISQQLWEGVTDDLRAAKGGPQAAALRQRINRFRVAVFKNTVDPLLGKGLDIHSVFDNAYMPLRYKHGARFNPEANGGHGAMEGGPSPLELDDAMARGGEMAPIYYPLMDASQLPKRGDFLRRGATSNSGTADQNLRRNTGRLLSEARFSKDARKVWRIRAAQSARMQEHMDVLFDLSEEYGRHLQPGEELLPGEVLFAPGLVKRLAAQQRAVLDNLANDPSGRGLTELLDAMTGENAAEARRLLETRGDYDFIAMPRHVVNRLRSHGSLRMPEGFELAWGTPTAMWKNLTLAGRPAWVVNNLLSNAMFLKLQGGKFKDVVKQLDKRYVAKLREAIGEDALPQVEGGGLFKDSSSSPRRMPEGAVGDFGEVMQRRVAQSRAGNLAARYVDWVHRVNGGMEDAFRRASYMSAVEKTASRAKVNRASKSFWRSKQTLQHLFEAGIDEASWKRGVETLDSYMNNYDALSPFERNILKPYVVPFYSFYKHAAKLLLTMPFNHPAKARLAQLWNQADEERMRTEGLDPELLPGWMKSDTLFLGASGDGDARFLNGGGMNPFNAVLDAPLNTMHPFFKLMYEQSTGRSTFTGREFSDPSVTRGTFGSEDLYRQQGDGTIQPIESTRPGLLEHLLQQVPQYNMAKQLAVGGTTYDTADLIDALIDPEGSALRDAEGNLVSERSIMAVLGSYVGYSERDYAVEALQERTLEGKIAAAEALKARQLAVAKGQSAATTSNPYGG